MALDRQTPLRAEPSGCASRRLLVQCAVRVRVWQECFACQLSGDHSTHPRAKARHRIKPWAQHLRQPRGPIARRAVCGLIQLAECFTLIIDVGIVWRSGVLPSHARANGSLPIPCMSCLSHRCSVSLLNKKSPIRPRGRLPIGVGFFE